MPNDAIQVHDATRKAGKARDLLSGKLRPKKKNYKSASVVDSDDEDACDSENESSRDDESEVMALPGLPSPKADESAYLKEKRLNMEWNAARLKALGIPDGVKALFSDSKGAGKGSSRRKAHAKVGGNICSRNVICIDIGIYLGQKKGTSPCGWPKHCRRTRGNRGDCVRNSLKGAGHVNFTKYYPFDKLTIFRVIIKNPLLQWILPLSLCPNKMLQVNNWFT
jgi:hypothetical protein